MDLYDAHTASYGNPEVVRNLKSFEGKDKIIYDCNVVPWYHCHLAAFPCPFYLQTVWKWSIEESSLAIKMIY